MMRKNALLTLALLPFLCFTQEIIKTQDFNRNSELGGDVMLNQSTVKTINNNCYKEFEVEATTAGDYYMDAWVLGAKIKEDSSFVNYDIFVNDVKTALRLMPTENNWHMSSVMASEKQIGKVRLQEGSNTISFVSKAPIIPKIEFVRLSTLMKKATVSDNSYSNFVEKIKNSPQQSKRQATTTSGSLNDGWENPTGNYFYAMNVDVKYSICIEDFYFAHDVVFVSCYGKNNFQHVLYFYSYDMLNVNDLSMVDHTHGGSPFTYLDNITIPYMGGYAVMVRPLIPGTEGLVDIDITVGGRTYSYSNCPVTAGVYQCSQKANGNTRYNTFTCNLSNPGNTKLYLDEALNFDPDYPQQQGRIIAVNNKYYSSYPKDFAWNQVSRIKMDASFPASGNIILSTNSAYQPEVTCDLYGRCGDYFIFPSSPPDSSFPNLKFDDAIKSQGGDACLNRYNCFLWSAGITDNLTNPVLPGENCSNNDGGIWYFSPTYPFSDYTEVLPDGRVDALASFDNYYGDPMRYVYMVNDTVRPCMVYTRAGTTYDNSILDLWYSNKIGYSHASVRRNANYHPHGYDWESKLGGGPRIFHPRHALEGDEYGYIRHHYRQDPSYTYSVTVKSLDEAIADGTSVLEKVVLSEEEERRLNEYVKTQPDLLKSEFENKYSTWKKTWELPGMEYHSSSRAFAKSKEYDLFIAFCEQKGIVVWPLVFEKYLQGDYLTSNAIYDLTLIDKLQNVAILKAIKDNNKKHKYTDRGEFIVRSPHSNRIRYIRKLMQAYSLPGTDNRLSEMTETNAETITYSNRNELLVSYNNVAKNIDIRFSLPDRSNISLSVHNLQSPIHYFFANRTLEKGEYSHTFNCSRYQPGIYLIKLLVNGNITFKKIIIN